jgi:hypothetical protein
MKSKPAHNNRLGGWQAWYRRHSRTIGSYDDQRNLDAAVPSIYEKQDTVEAKRII